MQHKDFKWYILQVLAGQEDKIATNIQSMNLSNVEEVLVPSKEVMEVKKGKKTNKKQKLYPGYVFIKANLDSDVYNVINSIPKVKGFLGQKNNPQPVSEEKMNNIFSLINSDTSSNKNLALEVGEEVNIIDGPFADFSGIVEEFDEEKQRVKVQISIFGRGTTVDLSVNQIEKKN